MGGDRDLIELVGDNVARRVSRQRHKQFVELECAKPRPDDHQANQKTEVADSVHNECFVGRDTC